MAMINGKEVGEIKIFIGGKEIKGVKSINYTPQYKLYYDLRPIWPKVPLKRLEPSIIEVLATGMHHDN